MPHHAYLRVIMDKVRSILENIYQQAESRNHIAPELSDQQLKWIETIVERAEDQKGVLAVLITSLAKKVETPTQDVRYHKTELPNGYSGRGLDTKSVTPFIREKFQRLAMKESGWLTRSLEQAHPYTLDYPGKIQRQDMKQAFLGILNDIEENQAEAEEYLYAIFYALITLMETAKVNLDLLEAANTDINQRSQADGVTIDDIINLLKYHFSRNYGGAGASRLPVLAVYTAYEMLMVLERYKGKTLLPLKSHTTADTKSHGIGDIEVIEENGDFFEAVEIKHNIPISSTIIENAHQKFINTSVRRYYLLTTAEPNVADEPNAVDQLIQHIRRTHGCEVIVNGILRSLKYYLRLLSNPTQFLDSYSNNLQLDFSQSTDIKRSHLQYWNELLATLITH